VAKKLQRWARLFSKCSVCGKSDSPHSGRGICDRCRRRARYRKRIGVETDFAWSLRHERCIRCLKTDSKHGRGGVCQRCRQMAAEQRIRDNMIEVLTFRAPNWDRVKSLETESSGYLGLLEIETYERFCKWQDSNRTNKEVN